MEVQRQLLQRHFACTKFFRPRICMHFCPKQSSLQVSNYQALRAAFFPLYVPFGDSSVFLSDQTTEIITEKLLGLRLTSSTFYTSHVRKVDDERVRKYCCNRSVNFPSPSINNKIKVYSFRSAHRVKQTANNVSFADSWLFVRATFSRRESPTVDKSVGELFEESNRKVIRQGSWRYPISFCSYSFLVSVRPGTRILSSKLPSSSFTRSWFKVYSPDGTPFVEKLLAE